MDVTATVTTVNNPVTNTASVSAVTQFDPDSSNNSSSATVTGYDVCDVNHDKNIDRVDINQIFSAIDTQVIPGDFMDLNGDGLISINDARGCVLQCSKPKCAP
jgi:hypothetical protein